MSGLTGEVPCVPHVVVVRGWEGGVRDGLAAVGTEDSFCQEEVAEKRRNQEILAEQLLRNCESGIGQVEAYQLPRAR